jgi:hemolysin III
MTNHGTDVVHEASERFRETVVEIKPKLRGWLHAVTVPLAFLAFLVMLVIADDVWVRFAVAIFMVSAMLLFGVSAVYHRGRWSLRLQGFWKRFDHANIFLLIAGSYTPYSILLLETSHWIIMLSLVWTGALLGVAFKIFWIGAPRWLYVPLYLLLGWAAILYFPEFADSASACCTRSVRSSTASSGPTRRRRTSASTRCSTLSRSRRSSSTTSESACSPISSTDQRHEVVRRRDRTATHEALADVGRRGAVDELALLEQRDVQTDVAGHDDRPG